MYHNEHLHASTQTANITLSLEESQRIGEAVIQELSKYADQPYLYLLDLVDVDIPAKHTDMRETYQKLMRSCVGLRCPSCRDTNDCMPNPSFPS